MLCFLNIAADSLEILRHPWVVFRRSYKQNNQVEKQKKTDLDVSETKSFICNNSD